MNVIEKMSNIYMQIGIFFYEKLILLFKKEIINKKEIDKIFEKALDKDLKENEILDTKKVTKTFKEY